MVRRIVRLVQVTLVLAFLFVGVVGCTSAPAAQPIVSSHEVSVSQVVPVPTPTPVPLPSPTALPRVSAGDGELVPPREPRRNPAPTSSEPAPPRVWSDPPQPDDSPAPFANAELYIHLPPRANQNQPLRVVLALHGMGAQNDAFAKPLAAEADRNNWIVIAPNFKYRDHMNTALVMEDDLIFAKKLVDTLDALPARLNLKLYPRALLFGFSRGAQLGHRFALMYPQRVSGVSVLSAGAYTLPFANLKNDATQPMLGFPYGIGDMPRYTGRPVDVQNLKRVAFQIQVGERDTAIADVPRAFDPYCGKDRVERARTFEQDLRLVGLNSRLVIFPNTGHEVTNEMRKSAVDFLRAAELAGLPND